MAIEVFNRYENKYRIDADTLIKLESRLSDHMELDAYNKKSETYTIANLYYDTPDSYYIRTSLSKPGYKEKLRLRAYGVPDADTIVYAEIKKKVGGLVNKRRSALKLKEAAEFLKSGEIAEPRPYHNRQVLSEIAYLLSTRELRPAVYLAYDRRAYFGSGGHDLRISFDRGIRARRYDLKLESGDYGAPLIGDDEWVMEIKTSQSIPLWLTRLLSEYRIYPVSFSKYGAEYTRLLESGASPQIVYRLRAQSPAPALNENRKRVTA
ncbi:MAG: polyphosphate polymerase domain-containing protein [Bacillota bacterium]